ncbi:hypothetical protein F4809DRAFT_627997 [Biscogniauxia mediterranea]|nr:hypothetical protein F4809DRAFT_627997 [Biscogniauxia mediterranea]
MSDTTEIIPAIIRITPEVGTNHNEVVSTPRELFNIISPSMTAPRTGIEFVDNMNNTDDDRHIIESSFTDLGNNQKIVPHIGGLVETIIRAYQQDLHLILRPDDIWLAILIQFNLFVNGNWREIIPLLIDDEWLDSGVQNGLPLSGQNSVAGSAAEYFVSIVQNNLIDPDFKDWFVPNFTTTTTDDITTAYISLLATVKEKFKHSLHGSCGFPSITLLGGMDDWSEILTRIDRIERFGGDCIKWAAALRIVVDGMLNSYGYEDRDFTKQFWIRAVNSTGKANPGQLTIVSGWITVFCFWDAQGRVIDDVKSNVEALNMDGVIFPCVYVENLPPVMMEVEMLFIDHRRHAEIETKLIARHVGATISTTAPENNARGIEDDPDATDEEDNGVTEKIPVKRV